MADPINKFALPSFVALPSLSGLTMGDRAPLLGARLRIRQTSTTAIPAGADATAQLIFQLTSAFRQTEAVWVESVSAYCAENDGAKQLSVIGVLAEVGVHDVGGGGIGSGFLLNVIPPPVVALPQTINPVGFWVEPPPVLRANDLPPVSWTGGPGIQLEVDVCARNADGAAPHSVVIFGQVLYRVISDVTP